MRGTGWKACALVAAMLWAGSGVGERAAAVAAEGDQATPGPAGVGALGRLEPQTGLFQLAATPGARLLGFTVKLGDAVKKDQVLAYLDTYPLQIAERDRAAAQLAEAHDRLKAQTALGDAQIEQAGGQQANGPQARLARATADEARVAIPIRSLQKALDAAELQVKSATIVAPIDGTVLDIQPLPGESIGNRPVLSMGDVSHMRVTAEVYETDLPRVQLGQSATVRSRAFAKPLTGHVVEIGRMVFRNSILSSDPAARADARIVPVRIALDGATGDVPGLSGLSNLTVDVVIDAPAAAGGNPQAASR
ncbi:MAG: efflux RND transporter periplasmic adaptor subunit [Alphaproteobacteria bacterium]|nr:efflux RND transporter periplasmic adaptor subunit [Alphaproteobacteria bacterium]